MDDRLTNQTLPREAETSGQASLTSPRLGTPQCLDADPAHIPVSASRDSRTSYYDSMENSLEMALKGVQRLRDNLPESRDPGFVTAWLDFIDYYVRKARMTEETRLVEVRRQERIERAEYEAYLTRREYEQERTR